MTNKQVVSDFSRKQVESEKSRNERNKQVVSDFSLKQLESDFSRKQHYRNNNKD